MIRIGITHVPRTSETLGLSLSTMPTGAEVTVYPDGMHNIATAFDVKRLGERAGCFKHWHRVLSDLCETDADIVGVMPDDIRYHSQVFNVAEKQLQKDGVGYVACFLPVGMQKRYKWQGEWNTCNMGWGSSWGGGYLFPIAVARELIKHPYIINHRDNYLPNQQIDHAVPEAIFRMGLSQWYHYPSLLKHIGYKSTIGHKHTLDEEAAGW